MSTIKKQYLDVHNLLTENAGKKLTAKLMAQLTELMESKVMSKTFRKDDDGNVTDIFCYYHKEWEAVADVEFGKKASTSTGLNTMCKQGMSRWTKQQRVMKQAKAQLLDDVANGDMSGEDIAEHIARIEEEAKVIEALS